MNIDGDRALFKNTGDNDYLFRINDITKKVWPILSHYTSNPNEGELHLVDWVGDVWNNKNVYGKILCCPLKSVIVLPVYLKTTGAILLS